MLFLASIDIYLVEKRVWFHGLMVRKLYKSIQGETDQILKTLKLHFSLEK